MTQIAEVLSRFGTVRQAAEKIGRAPSVIQYWRTSGSIPSKNMSGVLDAARRHGIKVSASDLIPCGGTEHSRAA
jgi:hypothetical protein